MGTGKIIRGKCPDGHDLGTTSGYVSNVMEGGKPAVSPNAEGMK